MTVPACIVMPLLAGGKTKITYTLPATTLHAVINLNSIAGYTSDAEIDIVIPAGMWCWASGVGSLVPALTITGGAPSNKVALKNYGKIGGNGGSFKVYTSETDIGGPCAGGPAINSSVALFVYNEGYIGGGGGSGGGSALSVPFPGPGAGGGRIVGSTDSELLDSAVRVGSDGAYIAGRSFPATGSIGNGVNSSGNSIRNATLGSGGAPGTAVYNKGASATSGGGGWGAKGGDHIGYNMGSVAYGGNGGAYEPGTSGTTDGGIIASGTPGAPGGAAFIMNGKALTIVSGSERIYGAII